MIYGSLLAGGNGTRMGDTELPKQFLLLGNKPIIIYSIEQFLKNKRINKLIIICVEPYIEHLKLIINEHIKDSSIIEIVSGGNTRNESVMCGCKYIENTFGIKEEDVILIHDSVRPFINQRIIDDNIDAVLKYGAVGTVIPSNDTVFVTDNSNDGFIKEIPNRDTIFLAQSPQSFNIKTLVELYEKSSLQERELMTDSCKIFTLNDKPVKLVMGDSYNLKITTPVDLEMASGIINKEHQDNRFDLKICNNINKFIKWLDWKSIILIFLIIMSFMLLDLGSRYSLKKHEEFFSIKKLAPILFSFSYILIFILILYGRKPKTRSIIYAITYSFFTLYTIGQIIISNILGKVASINDLKYTSEATNYLDFIRDAVGKRLILFILAAILFGTITFILLRKEDKKRTYNKFITIAFIILILVTRYTSILLLGKGVASSEWDAWNYPKNIYQNYNNVNRSYKISGTYEYFFRDIYLELKDLIQNNTKESIAYLDNYFSDKGEESKDDTFTGLFKGKNLIMIMLESIDDWLINEDTMPILYNLQKEGWNFPNRYAPAFGTGQTLNSEFASITGLYSPIKGEPIFNYHRNLYPLSLPNKFKEQGYLVNSLHFNYGSFYERTSLHKTLGFENHYSLIDMGYPTTTMDDRELSANEDIYKMIVPDVDKFFTFVTTYSAHGVYDDTNYMCDQIEVELEKRISKNKYEDFCIKELSKMTDDFIKVLIEKLKRDNKLDDTVIVLFSDHYAYAYPDIISHKQVEDRNMAQNTPFIIWSNDIKSEVFEMMVETADIVPTISNLYGINYNHKDYVGTNIFSDNHDNFVYFSDHSWFDGNIYYKGDHVSNYPDKNYVINISKKVNEKLRVNDSIVNSDYYRHIFKNTSK